MSTLTVQHSSTSENLSSSSSSSPTGGGSPSTKSSPEVLNVGEIPVKPKKKVKKIVKKKKQPSIDADAQTVLACGGQVVASKLPIFGPPVMFDESQLRIAFSMLDVNGDGRINSDELMDMLNRLGFRDVINEDIVKSLIRDATQNGDHLISEEQFLKWMPRLGITGAQASASSTSSPPSSSSPYSQMSSSSSSSGLHRTSSPHDERRSSYSVPQSYINLKSCSAESLQQRKARLMSLPSPDASHLKQMTPEEVDDCEKDLRAAFAVFDQDHNGFITRDELRSGLAIMGENLSESDIDDLLNLADVDKDGQINYEEFIQILL